MSTSSNRTDDLSPVSDGTAPPEYSTYDSTPKPTDEKIVREPGSTPSSTVQESIPSRDYAHATSPIPYIDDGGLPEVVSSSAASTSQSKGTGSIMSEKRAAAIAYNGPSDIKGKTPPSSDAAAAGPSSPPAPSVPSRPSSTMISSPPPLPHSASQAALGSPDQEYETVTPLHLLGDQSDTVDCPFCRRRAETRVKKTASGMTHMAATGLFLTTMVGAVGPYATKWKANVAHYCTNCDRKVAHRKYNEEQMTPLGTPEHLRQVSRYQPAAGSSPAVGRSGSG